MASRDLLSLPVHGAADGTVPVAGRGAPLASRPRPRGSAWLWAVPTRVVFFSLAGLATGSAFIGAHSLWLDETFSIAFSRASATQVWHRVGLEVNMALYHGVLHFWLYLGTDATTVRMLSVLFAVATVPVFYGLVARLYDHRTATVACALLVVNPFYVQYAQEARAYSLAMLFATATTYLFVRAVQLPSRWGWVAYAFVAGLSTYVHLFLALVVVGHAVALYATQGRGRLRRQTTVGAFAAAALIAAPVIYLAQRQIPSHESPLSKPTAVTLLSAFTLASGDRAGVASMMLFLLALLATVLFAIAAWKGRRGTSASRDAVVLSWFLVPIAISYVVSFARPTFAPRYLIVSVPALLIMGAVALIRSSSLRLVLTALATVLSLSLAVDWRYYHDHLVKEDWRDLSAYLVGAARPGDGLIVYQPWNRTPLDYYLVRHGGPIPLTPVYPSFGFSVTNPFAPGPDLASPGAGRSLARSAARHRRVWIVFSATTLANPTVQTILSGMAGRPRVVDRNFVRITLLLYGPRRSGG
jgi:mannosyltransferase